MFGTCCINRFVISKLFSLPDATDGLVCFKRAMYAWNISALTFSSRSAKISKKLKIKGIVHFYFFEIRSFFLQLKRNS